MSMYAAVACSASSPGMERESGTEPLIITLLGKVSSTPLIQCYLVAYLI